MAPSVLASPARSDGFRAAEHGQQHRDPAPTELPAPGPSCRLVAALRRSDGLNGILEVGLGAAPSLDQCDACGCTRKKDVTQSVAAVATELKDQVSEISDKTSTGTQLNDIAIHCSIIPIAGN
jgi:hypothetical protein